MRGSALLHDRVILIEVTKELFRNMGNDPNYTWVKDTSSKLEYVQLYRWYGIKYVRLYRWYWH